MSDTIKILAITWLLRLNGIVLALAFVPLFFPVQWMSNIHAWIGLGVFPDQPITVYLARSLSAFYFLHGLLGLYLAQTLEKNWHWIPIMAGAHLFLAIVFFLTDIAAQMPWWWTWFEGPPIAGYCIGLFVLWFTANPASGLEK